MVDLHEALQSAKMFSQTSFDSESFEYFKIRGDLEEVEIIKSIPN
jgi:hypothetical protein